MFNILIRSVSDNDIFEFGEEVCVIEGGCYSRRLIDAWVSRLQDKSLQRLAWREEDGMIALYTFGDPDFVEEEFQYGNLNLEAFMSAAQLEHA